MRTFGSLPRPGVACDGTSKRSVLPNAGAAEQCQLGTEIGQRQAHGLQYVSNRRKYTSVQMQRVASYSIELRRKMEALPTMQTILVCDDDELLVELLTHRLGARGYHVVVAADGGAAVRQASECDPDAIVLDMMMPVLDGQQVLRRLKADPATADIPVIMLTARRQERDIVGTLELGADDYLVKPFIPEELMSRLARLVTTSR